MKNILLLLALGASLNCFCQVPDSSYQPAPYSDTVQHFYIVFLRSDTTMPYASRQVQGYIVLHHNEPGTDQCGNSILQTIDPLIYLDEKRKPIDWGKYMRYDERSK